MFAIKFILLVITFCTSTLIGILISRRYSNRVHVLNDLKNALNMFQVKINFSVETIPEIFTDISKKVSGVAGKFFKDTVTYINKENMLAR